MFSKAKNIVRRISFLFIFFLIITTLLVNYLKKSYELDLTVKFLNLKFNLIIVVYRIIKR